jgi:outer membrane protein assembly factor BamB
MRVSQENRPFECLRGSATVFVFWAVVCWPLMVQGNDDWARFRGPTGQGTAASSKLPTTWTADENVAWKTPLSGAGASSPIVFGDRVYLTYYDGYFVPGEEGGSTDQLTRHLMAINLSDGAVIWDQSVAAKLPEEERIRDHGFAANSVAVDQQRIYAFFGKSGVTAFDHEGKEIWTTDVGSGTHGWGTSASPVLFQDLVIINASVESESLVALRQADGKEVWRVEGIREAWNTPIVIETPQGRTELVMARQGDVMSFDPQTGETLWTCKTDIGWYMVPSVVYSEGVVYCLGGRSGTAALAVKVDGRGDVTESHRLWTSRKGSNVTSPVFHQGHLYWMHEQQGVAYCADAATGEVLYEERLDRAGQVYASALLADGRLYYVTRGGRTFVLAAKPEFEQLAANDLRDGGVFNGSPAAAGNRLLIRSDKFLYCLENR